MSIMMAKKSILWMGNLEKSMNGRTTMAMSVNGVL